MISALTLFLSLDQKIKKEIKPIRNFFLRRFFRIVPLFYLLGLFNIVFTKFSLVNIISTFSFTNGFIPDVMMQQIVGNGWTLAVEMVFYMMLPILYACVKNVKGALMLFAATLIFSIGAKYIMFHQFGAYYDHETLVGYTYYWLPAQLPVFSLGIIIYFILFKTDFNNESEFSFKIPLGYLLIFCGIYFVVTLSFSSKLFITENIGFSFALMLFIFGMAINPTSLFNNKAIRFLGKISYSFYLIHGIIIEKLIPFFDRYAIAGNMRFVSALIIILTITSVISYISYLVIEQPFQKLGARIIERLESNKTTKLEYDTVNK